MVANRIFYVRFLNRMAANGAQLDSVTSFKRLHSETIEVRGNFGRGDIPPQVAILAAFTMDLEHHLPSKKRRLVDQYGQENDHNI